MHRTRLRAPALACAAALLSGCFTYVPTQLGSVREGAQIRLHLDPATQVALSNRANRRIEETVEGTFAGRQQDQVLIKMPIASQQEGFFRSDIAQNLEVPAPGVVGVDMRTFSRGRTALLVAGSAAVAGAIVGLILSHSSNGAPPGGDGSNEIRIPLASFNVR